MIVRFVLVLGVLAGARSRVEADEAKPLGPIEARTKLGSKIVVELEVKAAKDRLEKRGEIYLDAEESVIRRWYIERFLRLRETAFRNPASYFHRYAAIPEGEAITVAEGLWSRINLVNLSENILPTRPRADLILRKSASHAVEEVALRRI